ncbi:MAG: T9SS type A sorting domain-containing protein [Bacteroidia bacterium]|nr:T9SS type A sorting domain-containing protein [Bacteroidia bacterium]
MNLTTPPSVVLKPLARWLFFVFTCSFFLSFQNQLFAQTITVTELNPFVVTKSTEDKPQSKVWSYQDNLYCIMPNSAGTHIWKLIEDTWTLETTIDTATLSAADIKVIGNRIHVMLFDDLNDKATILTRQYDETSQTFIPWDVNPASISVSFGNGGGNFQATATMDIDSQGIMWIAYERKKEVYVMWSQAPYTSWSAPIILTSAFIDQRDIASVIAFTDNSGSKVGVIWSDQVTKKFTFRVHVDGDDPSVWSADENPSAGFAQPINLGVADDHFKLVAGTDGTLYMAAKTSYDSVGFPTIILMVRRPNATWEYYPVDAMGTKPTVTVNEDNNVLHMFYTYPDIDNGSIGYKQVGLDELNNLYNVPIVIALDKDAAPAGLLDFASSTKSTWSGKTAVLAYHASTQSVRSVVIESPEGTGSVPWTEDFADLPNGTTSDEGSSGWSLNTTQVGNAAVFSVQAQKFRAQYTVGEGVWMSEVINISEAPAKISLQIQSQGPLESTGIYRDYIRVYYKLDDGNEVLITEKSGNINYGNLETVTISDLTGSTLQIVIRALTTGTDEAHVWDNVKVYSPKGEVLMVVGNSQTLNAGDLAMKTQLETLGYEVILKTDQSSSAADAVGKDLIVISSTVNSLNVNTKFRDVAVPVLNCEAWLFDDMKMTGTIENTDYGSVFNTSQIFIANTGGPLTAGMSGMVQITSSGQEVGFGKPAANCIKVARLSSNSIQHVLFAYESGTSMVGMNAPARRVGFYFRNETAANSTGTGWSLFDAAVCWAMNCNNDPVGQAITFAPIQDKLTTDPAFALTATASSGLPVTLEIVSGPATLSGNTVTLTGVTGTVTIRATQPGNASYLAADTVVRSFEVLEPILTTLISSRVAAWYDDAEETVYNGSVNRSSTDIELVKDGSISQVVGLRFRGLNIPQGSIITDAYIQFTTDELDFGATNLTLKAQASDNSDAFGPNPYNISSRPKTTASVAWAPILWNQYGVSGAAQRTPDLSTLVQEVVNRPGWSASSALTMIVSGTGERTAESYEGSPSRAPIIYVEYLSPATTSTAARKSGVDDTYTQISSTIFPNPFQDQFRIESEFPNAKWVNIKVLNVLGQPVYQVDQYPVNQGIKISQNWAQGIYYIVLKSDLGQSKTMIGVRN